MQIYVDADACPVVGIVEELAIKYKIPVTLLCDTNHVLYSDYSEVKIIGAGADAVDFAREFDTLKSKKVPQSLEIGLFFCQIFIFII